MTSAGVPRPRLPFVQDVRANGLLHAAVVFAPSAPARLLELDTSDAHQSTGVRALLTAADVEWQPRLRQAPLLAQGVLRTVSDRLALVAADSQELARLAARKVRARVEGVPAVHEASSAHLASASAIWAGEANVRSVSHFHRGDVGKALAASKYTLHRRYTLPWQDALAAHPHSVMALPTSDGMEIRAGMEHPGRVRAWVADVLGLQHARVTVTAQAMGGGFGHRDGWTAELAACAALLARKTGRPVRLTLDREDELRCAPKRPRCLVDHTLAADTDGRITAIQMAMLWDGGPYDSDVLELLTHMQPGLLGPYDVKDMDVEMSVARTNNARVAALVGGALLPTVVALESQVDTMARDLGLHPTLVRELNLPRVRSKRPRAAMDVVKRAEPRVVTPVSKWVKRGVGVALCCHRPRVWNAAARVDVHADGSVTLRVGTADTGAEHPVTLAQLAAHALLVDASVVHVYPGPDAAPFSPQDGRAVGQACTAVLKILRREAATLLGVAPTKVKRRAGAFVTGKNAVSFAQAAAAAHARGVAPCGFGQGATLDETEVGWAATVAEVDVDLCTGLVKVTRVVSGHEAGAPWHADGVTREVEAGARMGAGYALSEEWVMENGVFQEASLMHALMQGAKDGPPVDVVLLPAGPLHSVMEVAVGVAAAAVRNAVANALGDAPLELPCTPERIMEVLVGRGLDPLTRVA